MENSPAAQEPRVIQFSARESRNAIGDYSIAIVHVVVFQIRFQHGSQLIGRIDCFVLEEVFLEVAERKLRAGVRERDAHDQEVARNLAVIGDLTKAGERHAFHIRGVANIAVGPIVA